MELYFINYEFLTIKYTYSTESKLLIYSMTHLECSNLNSQSRYQRLVSLQKSWFRCHFEQELDNFPKNVDCLKALNKRFIIFEALISYHTTETYLCLPLLEHFVIRCADSIPGSGTPLEQEMATHSSILIQKVPLTEEPGELQSCCKELDMTEHTCKILFFFPQTSKIW